MQAARLRRAQVVCRRFAGPTVGDNFERDLLALVEAVQARALHCADVHEDVLASAIGRNEAVALLSVESLHGSFDH